MSDPNAGNVVIVMSRVPRVGVLSAIPVPAGYTNHIGSGRDPAGNIFWAVTVDGPNSGDVDVAILRRDVATGVWDRIWTWDERTYGKHGYGTLQPLPDGSLSCGLAERDAAGQTVAIERIVPKEQARVGWAASGGGGFVQAPGGAVTVYNAPLDGGVSIDLAAHDIPPASCYSYQIQVIASVAGRRAFVGSGGPAYANVQAIAQVPGIENSICGIAAPGPQGTLVINADAGHLTSCQVYILGWWY